MCVALVIVHALTTPRIGVTQEGNGLQPMAIPSTAPRILCRLLPNDVATRPGVAYRLQFEIGEPQSDNRQINVSYDSVGNAIDLVELATVSAGGGRAVVHAIMARFGVAGATDVVAGVHGQSDGTPSKARAGVDSLNQQALVQRTFPPLTEHEQEQARTLARWLWEHRCGRQQKPAP